MLFMNEYDVAEMHRNLDPAEVPHLATGVRILYALMNWTNAHSDGWAYWPKPARAARALMEALYERDYAIRFGHDRDGSPLTDLTAADLKRVVAPIKAFLTRQGVSHDDLPWAAILPAA